jgi:hypothetical protein
MLLSKVKAYRPILLWKSYSIWLIFCASVLVLTNVFASLTLVRAYRFTAIDVVLTYGFIIFWAILEATVVAALITLVEVLLENAFGKRLDLMFRLMLVILLVTTWVILLLTVLRVI